MQKPESVGSCIPFGGAVTGRKLYSLRGSCHRSPLDRDAARRTQTATEPTPDKIQTRRQGSEQEPDKASRTHWQRHAPPDKARHANGGPPADAGRPKNKLFNCQSAGVKPLTAGKKTFLPTGKSSKQQTPPDHRKTPSRRPAPTADGPRTPSGRPAADHHRHKLTADQRTTTGNRPRLEDLTTDGPPAPPGGSQPDRQNRPARIHLTARQRPNAGRRQPAKRQPARVNCFLYRSFFTYLFINRADDIRRQANAGSISRIFYFFLISF